VTYAANGERGFETLTYYIQSVSIQRKKNKEKLTGTNLKKQ
jgi:hypothetical protein